ncbi:MAG: transposase [Clostridia bacterium]|nr:transposase [Clostridia bacterium]
MNIFRQKYRIVKEELKIFGRIYKGVLPTVRSCGDFWVKVRDDAVNNTWNYAFATYLGYYCVDEEMEFIDAVFFQGQSIVAVSSRFHLSERLSYFWCDTILKDLIALAVDCGLISFETDTAGKEVASAVDFEIDENLWTQIESLVSKSSKRVQKNLRHEVEAMAIATLTETKWRDLPEKYGPWKTAYNKYNLWVKSGLWKRIETLLNCEKQRE